MKYKELLTEIRARHGKLTPEIVLEEARPDDSPLHAYVFDKEVEDAAEAYYLDRAHQLIQRVRIVVKKNDTEQRSVRAFLAVPSDTDRYVYEPVDVVVSDEQKFNMVRLEASRRLRDAEAAVDDLDALAAGTPFKRTSKRVKTAIRTARQELDKVA